MSPEACEALMGQIVPRLKSAIPRCVRTVGAEDHEELVQDGIAIAAKMLHLSEAAGKMAPAASVAYYTLQHLKSGRRSTGNSRADVLATGTQLDLSSAVLSLEEVVGYDEELGEPIVLEELLASRADDPSMAGGRNVDWEQFLGLFDLQYGMVVSGLAKGERPCETARANGITPAKLKCLTINLAADLLDHMGEQIIDDSVQVPAWKGNLRVRSERVACLADRRRW